MTAEEMIETVREVLNTGLQAKRITDIEAEFVNSRLAEFLSDHPDYKPRMAREKGRDPEEEMLWEDVQPILDKAQGVGK